MKTKKKNKRMFVKHINRVIDGSENLTSKELEKFGYGALGFGVLMMSTDFFVNHNFTDISLIFASVSTVSAIPFFRASDEVRNEEGKKQLLKELTKGSSDSYASRKK